jgi:hypothetical protein
VISVMSTRILPSALYSASSIAVAAASGSSKLVSPPQQPGHRAG